MVALCVARLLPVDARARALSVIAGLAVDKTTDAERTNVKAPTTSASTPVPAAVDSSVQRSALRALAQLAVAEKRQAAAGAATEDNTAVRVLQELVVPRAVTQLRAMATATERNESSATAFDDELQRTLVRACYSNKR
jgi:hypothetical protein